MVAILLSVVLGYLSLADQVIDRGIDLHRRDAESPGSVAVDGEIDRAALRLLIGTEVGELRHALQGGEELWRPGVQFGQVRIRQGVLILRLSRAATDIDVLRRLKERLHPDEFRKRRAKSCDHLVRCCLATAGLGLQSDA